MIRSRRYRSLPVLGAVAVAAALGPRSAQALTTIPVASGLNRPIFVTAPPNDSRLFIVEQRGLIKILKNGNVLATPFLDIDALIPDPGGNDERGLLGLAFDPGFAQNRRFYVNYYSNGNQTIIARYRASVGNPDVAVADSAETIISIAQPYTNHNGGTIAFSPVDHYLYIGMGDGGSGGDPEERAQNPLELLGKFLRIDVSGPSGYVVPPSNPFVGNPAYRPEIWAMGVRNPYRWCFDRLTGDHWIADVGQNNWEEIDFDLASSAGGRNYGWDNMEGTHCYEPPSGCDQVGMTLPIYEYSHANGCSITGGYIYRGSVIPTLSGTYFFADFCSNKIWSFRYTGGSVTEFTDRTTELAPGGGLSIGSIAGFGEDSLGELYIVDRGTATTGEIYKLVSDPADAPTGAPPVRSGLEFRSVTPNPLASGASFTLVADRSGLIGIDVVDASGRILRHLEVEAAGAGPVSAGWDGRDAEGRTVPAAVYFARAALGGQRVTRTLNVVR